MATGEKVSSAQRHRMIEEAAYLRAERRGFAGDNSKDDWLEAEAEVDARLRQIEDEQFLDRVEEGLAAATKRLAALKRKIAGLSVDARKEWQRDMERLASLRDDLRPKVAKLRKEGERAGRRARAQAEALRRELAELLERLSAKRRP
jgi:hypothetical protein